MNQPKDKIIVSLHIISTIRDDGQTMEEEQQLEGQLFHKDGIVYLRYEETIEGTGDVQNTLKISKEKVQLIRHGVVRMNHIYKLGEVTSSYYLSPHGRLEMESSTLRIEYDPLIDGKARLLLGYELLLSQVEAGSIELDIRMKVI